MSHTEVSIQNDPIDAIVAAGEKILIEVAQSIRHRSEDYRHSSATATNFCLAPDFWALLPEGPLFRSSVCEKA
jgi:3-dehydroquinate dehydratase